MPTSRSANKKRDLMPLELERGSGSEAGPDVNSPATSINQPTNLRGKNKRKEGTKMVWPKGVQERYGISSPTRWRWEKDRKLPPRDVFIGGVPTGWRPETLDAADRGATPGA